MELKEKTLSSEELYNGKIIRLKLDEALLPNGNTALREVVEHPSGVAVAAVTDDNELLFVRQFRYPFKEIVLELPAGKLEKGMTPLENGKRELLEETGAVGYNYVSLGAMMVSPGFCNEVVHLFMCKVDHFERQQLDDDEFVNVEKIPIDKAVEMVINNQMFDGKTQLAVLKTAVLLKNSTL